MYEYGQQMKSDEQKKFVWERYQVELNQFIAKQGRWRHVSEMTIHQKELDYESMTLSKGCTKLSGENVLEKGKNHFITFGFGF
jgi:hypothetical protein